MPESLPSGGAQVLLRVWVEEHDRTLRGRLVVPEVAERPVARGVDALCDLVCRALQQVEDELA